MSPFKTLDDLELDGVDPNAIEDDIARRAREAERWRGVKAELAKTMPFWDAARSTQATRRSSTSLSFPRLPRANFSRAKGVRFSSADILEDGIAVHLEEHVDELSALADVMDAVTALRRTASVADDDDQLVRHMHDFTDQLSMHLFNQRQHDREILEVLRRIESQRG